MSRSYHTAPARVIARRRAPSQPPCRIVERHPAPGDIHPISAQQLRRIIQGIYGRYFYGLRAIELLPRNGEIGIPYGEYLNDERVIRLYSLPYPKWRFSGKLALTLPKLHGAEISHEGDSTIATRQEPVDLAYFFYRVLLHELGHHFHNRYRTKRPHPRTPAAKESSAERHSQWLAKLSAFQGWYEE